MNKQELLNKTFQFGEYSSSLGYSCDGEIPYLVVKEKSRLKEVLLKRGFEKISETQKKHGFVLVELKLSNSKDCIEIGLKSITKGHSVTAWDGGSDIKREGQTIASFLQEIKTDIDDPDINGIKIRSYKSRIN